MSPCKRACDDDRRDRRLSHNERIEMFGLHSDGFIQSDIFILFSVTTLENF